MMTQTMDKLETFAPYEQFLRRADVWPSATSTGPVELTPMDDMSPERAAASYNKVLTWFKSQSAARSNGHSMSEDDLRNMPMMRALVKQALDMDWMTVTSLRDPVDPDAELEPEQLIEEFIGASEHFIPDASAVQHYRSANVTVKILDYCGLAVFKK
jgi:hypothetical protein